MNALGVKIFRDVSGNAEIDISNGNGYESKEKARAFREALKTQIEWERLGGRHFFSVKLSNNQTRVFKYVLDAGMKLHHANTEKAIAFKCLQNHAYEACNYQNLAACSINVTGVVFNSDLDKFLAVQETGTYNGWKAPSTAVDLEKSEGPLEAIIRKIREETNVNLNPIAGLYIANTWTKKMQDNCPGIGYVFTFQVVASQQEIKTKPNGEIRKIEWLSIADFMNSKDCLDMNHIYKQIIDVAHKGFSTRNCSWKSHYLTWETGRPVTLYSSF